MKKLNTEKIAEKLKALRGSLTREHVANELGISVSALAMYESGQRIPRDEIKQKIAKFYKKDIDFIFFNN